MYVSLYYARLHRSDALMGVVRVVEMTNVDAVFIVLIGSLIIFAFALAASVK